jgi:hypothetical protein
LGETGRQDKPLKQRQQADAEVNARGTLAHMHRVQDPMGLWFLHFVYHIDYLVIPYASPFLLILWTHPEWWPKLIGIRTGFQR